MARRKARELAFRTLFMASRSETPVLDVWRQVREDLDEAELSEDSEEAYGDHLDEAGVEFAGELIGAWSRKHELVDETLLASLEGWTFNQMNQSDLNILRLAVTELLHDNDVPMEVTVEMAVRQAKKFGGEESGKFVNGVLGRVVRSDSFSGRQKG